MSRKRETLLSVLMAVLSSLVALALVELGWYALSDSQDANPSATAWERIMFFDAPGSIFRNVGRVFTYAPNALVHSVTVYFTDRKYAPEYDYWFSTNNFGLVQDKDIVPGKDSILLLGDSFTEGQGAEPWFRKLAPRIEAFGYQPINGGILGTGFAQWWELRNYLVSSGVNVGKVMVLFISDDYRRPIWNFPGNVMQCLSELSSCSGQEGFYRLPPAEQIPAWVDQIRGAQKNKFQEGWLRRKVVQTLPATYRAYTAVADLIKPLAKESAESTIKNMIKEHGAANVLFVHLPQIEEIDGPRREGVKLRQAIKGAGGRLVDAAPYCMLTRDDYYLRDGHPNVNGYAKIADCVARIAAEFLEKAAPKR